MATMVIGKFGGKVPMTVDELVELPGVGRKTANVITSVIDGQPNMAVDTHVFRVSKRIGLVPASASTPLAVELQLVREIPLELIHKAHHWLILHGRYICVARNPKCEQCGIRPVCNYYQKILRQGLIS
jgi:endonuclease-3